MRHDATRRDSTRCDASNLASSFSRPKEKERNTGREIDGWDGAPSFLLPHLSRPTFPCPAAQHRLSPLSAFLPRRSAFPFPCQSTSISKYTSAWTEKRRRAASRELVRMFWMRYERVTEVEDERDILTIFEICIEEEYSLVLIYRISRTNNSFSLLLTEVILRFRYHKICSKWEKQYQNW